MSKVLITTIGGVSSQEYRKANYLIDNKEYKDKKFILSALDEHYKFDKIFVLGTTASMWDAFYEYICEINKISLDENKYEEIYNQCSKTDNATDLQSLDLTNLKEILPEKYQIRLMKFGINEEEMVENFKSLLEIVDNFNDEEIYLDLTHGFRSNAFYMFMVMNYINEIKNSTDKIKGIFYGMYEAKMNPTPVLNLKIFSDISTLLKGVHDIKSYGNFYTISEMIEDEKTRKKLIDFSNSLNINYIGEVKEKIKELSSIIENINNNENLLIRMIIPKTLEDFIKRFGKIKENYLFLLEISKWYCEQKKYATAYLTMKEAITAFFCEKYLETTTKDSLEETDIKLNKLYAKYNNTRYSIERLDINFKNLKKLLKIFKICRDIRNNIAHSGEDRLNALKDIGNISDYTETLTELFKNKSFAEYIKNSSDI